MSHHTTPLTQKRSTSQTLRTGVLVVLASLGMASGCAHGPDTDTHAAPQKIVAQPEVDYTHLHNAWRTFKHDYIALDELWTLTDADTAMALKESGLSGEDFNALSALYTNRNHSLVFFAKDLPTDAGKRARDLVEHAWAHGIERPAAWPTHLDRWLAQYDQLRADIAGIVAEPLPSQDTSRLSNVTAKETPSKEITLGAEHLSSGAMEQLSRLLALQTQLRQVMAHLDGSIISAVWQLARATREPVFAPHVPLAPVPAVLFTAPETALDKVVPNHEDYHRLTAAYRQYWDLHTSNALKPLPTSLKLGVRVGQSHPELPRLRQRLAAEGFMPGDAPATAVSEHLTAMAEKKGKNKREASLLLRPFTPKANPKTDDSDTAHEGAVPQNSELNEDSDRTARSDGDLGEDTLHNSETILDAELQEQLRAFQYTRSLPLTGELDEQTYTALNVSTEKLLWRLEFGLKRWHNSRTRTSDRYVRVGINQFQVQLVRNGEIEQRYKAVIGKRGSGTPRLNGKITHLVVYPWWWGTRGNPTAVAPGPHNPLGLLVLKIDPAQYLIYLHGTNAPKLLNHAYRYYSKGCVRMSDPTELAGILLDEDPGRATSKDLKRLMAKKETRVVDLVNDVDVFLEYNTTFVNEETGYTHFAKDMYRNDRNLAPRLKHQSPIPNTWDRMAKFAH